MENLKRIKAELIVALSKLYDKTLPDNDKIKECDKIICDTIFFLHTLIECEEKEELYIDTAHDLLMEKHEFPCVIQKEYRNGDVWFEFYIAAHDYSAGRDSDTISEREIKKELILKMSRSGL